MNRIGSTVKSLTLAMFTGGEKVEGSYPMAYFAQLQTSASGVQQIPVPISLTRMDVAFENGSAKLSVELQWDVAADEIKVYTTTTWRMPIRGSGGTMPLSKG